LIILLSHPRSNVLKSIKSCVVTWHSDAVLSLRNLKCAPLARILERRKKKSTLLNETKEAGEKNRRKYVSFFTANKIKGKFSSYLFFSYRFYIFFCHAYCFFLKKQRFLLKRFGKNAKSRFFKKKRFFLFFFKVEKFV